MCGIAGVVLPDMRDADRAVALMCDQMIARGPDDAGVALLTADDAAVALGNRRLAIIDPSSAGHQPMKDDVLATTVVFNGMIYNYRELRAQLIAEGEHFASNCDTEVVLKAYGRWGGECARRLRGMFAFAVWDGRRQELFLARDRLGIKPLYYWRDAGEFLFASQVKALLETDHVPARLSPAGVGTYLAYGAVSEPLTAIDGVFALPAAHVATLRSGRLKVERYWSPPEVSRTTVPREDAVRELRARLEDSVERHLISDAPLGVYLSGGVDSSVLAALAARHTSHLRTVSVVFDASAYSEAPYMDLVARHVGGEHVRLTLRPDDLLAWRGDIFRAMDQPTFDGINTYAVTHAAARAGLKVALSGLGADELFDGYGYARRIRTLDRARRLPPPVARLAGAAAGVAMRGSNREKMAAWLSGRAGGSSYDLLRRVFLGEDIQRIMASSDAPALIASDSIDASRDLYAQVSVLDLANYTKNVLLRDTDAMSMAHSLEVRVPYLDGGLVEWMLSLPGELKAGGKALLADATRDLLPQEIFARRKQGFGLPLASWMAGELRSEVEAKLLRPPEALAEVLDAGAVAAVWADFTRDGRRWHRPWALYSLCSWAETVTSSVGSIA